MERSSWINFFSKVFQRVLEVHQYRFLVKNSCTFLSSLHTAHPHLRCNRKNELQWRKSPRDDSSSGPDLNGDLREVHNSEGTIRILSTRPQNNFLTVHLLIETHLRLGSG